MILKNYANSVPCYSDYLCAMAQKKLFRFGQLSTFPNVKEYPEDMKGKWSEFFGNTHPVWLELACGRGEYTYCLAKLHPNMNFLGVDVKGNRMYIGAKKALDEGINNAGFLRTQIEMLGNYFGKGEVNGLWITFPDPQLRASKAKKRLTHPRFLRIYQQILAPGAIINLKTDSPDLYEFTKLVISLYGLNLIADLDDISDSTNPELMIRTHYESLDIAKSNTVHFLSFSLPPVLPENDEELKQRLLYAKA